MSDYTTATGHDTTIVEIAAGNEVRYRCEALGCTEARLRESVQAVGNSPEHVRAYLEVLSQRGVFWGSRASHRLASEEICNDLQHFGNVEWLLQVSVVVAEPLPNLPLAKCGLDQDRNMFRGLRAADRFPDVRTIQPRHHHVKQHKIWERRLHAVPATSSIGLALDAISLHPKQDQ